MAPGSPSAASNSAFVMMSMFGCLSQSTSRGEMVHIAQSFVGNVLSSCAMRPPMPPERSMRWTLNPASARSSDACMPAIPPPTTATAPIFPVSPCVCSARSFMRPALWLSAGALGR